MSTAIATVADPISDPISDLTARVDRRSWPFARCADGAGTLTPLFFSDHVVDIARAKAICAKCALRSRCLREALDRREPSGVWGGELVVAGAIAAKRPNGRPPKHPRPALVVDELGVVQDPAVR